MNKKIENIKQALIESINNYPLYKKELINIYLLLKKDIKYEKNILKYFNPEKEENFFKLLFLFFFHHHKWINPYNINIFYFEDFFKIIEKEKYNNLEKLTIKEIDSQKIAKIFIYWFFYVLIFLSKNFKENIINNKFNNDTILINEIKNILFQTNNKIINSYKIKKLNIEQVFVFLYIYLFWIEYHTKINTHEKDLKIINNLLFTLLFDLFQKISIIILSDNKNNDQSKYNITIFYEYLCELKNNTFVHNDYNIIILLNNNIIQSFIENIIININPKIMEKIYPEYSDKLADFYSVFLKFRFNKSKLMDFLINNTKNSFINLNYFESEKEKILNDVFIQNFQTDLIRKLFKYESNNNLGHPKFDSFLFNGYNSKIILKLNELNLNDNLIFFSFHIKPNLGDNNLFNKRQPLISLYNNNNELKFKLYLKKVDSNIKNDINNKSNNKNNQFELNIYYNNKEKEMVLNEFGAIESNITYYIYIHLNISFIQIYLCSSSYSKSFYIKTVGKNKMNFKNEEIILNIGYDNFKKQIDFFSGYIGNLYIIKLYNNKNRIDYENNKYIIEQMLELKDFYRYIIYLNFTDNLENKTNYNLNYISLYKKKNDIYKPYKTLENIKKTSKNFYEILLCLSPELFKFIYINEENINNIRIPIISGISNIQKDFVFNNIDITFVKYDYSQEIFLMKNGFNYFCLQFEYFFQFANNYISFKNNNQPQKETEQNNNLIFYKENVDIFIKLIKNTINNTLLMLTQFIVDLNIIKFSVVLKQIFTTLLAAMKSLNIIGSIIDPTIHQLNTIIIVICEKIVETYNLINFNNKNKIILDENSDLKYFISFRDGLIDILLTNEFYIESTDNKLIELLFEKISSIIEITSIKDITVTFPNIFLKILNFTSLILDSFKNFNPNDNKNNLNNNKGKNYIINTFLKLIKGLIVRKKNFSSEDIFFKQLFIFALEDYKDNNYVSYAFLTIINDLLKEGFSLDENEIEELINYLSDNINNKEISLDSNNDINDEKYQEKFKNDHYFLIISIILTCIFDKNKKDNFNFFCSQIKTIELNETLFISIIREMLNIISNIINQSIKNKNNTKNEKIRKKSSSSSINSENIEFMNYNEDLFKFILILIRKKFSIDENINNDDLIQFDKDKNKTINNKINSLNKNKQDRIQLELINLIFFIEEMVSAQINNSNFQISTIYFLLSLIKFFHIIVFDDKLINLFLEDNFLLSFKNNLDSCINSKIIYTNYYISPFEKSSSILKTIPETIMDIFIKLINSNILKKDKKNNLYSENILTNNDILDILKKLFLNDKKGKNDIKENENIKRSLFCYNDFYRYLFSKNITNLESELNKVNKDKIINKYFPKFNIEHIQKIMYINNLLINREKKFNYNFISFNIEKITKYKNNIESSCPIKDDLSNFFDTLLLKLIKEHEILYEINNKFFFQTNTNSLNYKYVINSIVTKLNKKTFDCYTFKELIEKTYNEKQNVYEITSSLCENIKDINKLRYNITYFGSKNKKEKMKRKSSINSNNESIDENYAISSPKSNELYLNISVKIENSGENIINNSRKSSISSSSDLASLPKEEALSQNEESINNIIINNYIENTKKNDDLNLSNNTSMENQNKKPLIHSNSFSLRKPNIFSLKKYLNKNNKKSKKNVLEDIKEINNICYFNNIDSMYSFNTKKDLIKNIFSLYFMDTIFYDETFIELKKLYVQTYGDKIKLERQKDKYLNYPSKIKNFSNGVEPPLFINPFNNFFEHKTFPISHKYFNNFFQNYKKKYKTKYINLFQKSIQIPEKEITCQYNCELIKISYSKYGSIIYSKSSGYLYFKEEDFGNIYDSNKNKIYYDGIFSLTHMKYKDKKNKKEINNYKSKQLIPKDKNILILISEIEEIVERRFLLMWQGFEIYLKDGRSYFFNLLSETKYEKFKSILIENNELKQLIHKKDYLTKQKSITKAWENNIITTYEYLLLINKYASRSFNDPNQYYVFPWILKKIEDLININNNKNTLYENNNNKIDNNSENQKFKDSLRDLKYPISLQTEASRDIAIYRYIENDETNFPYHLGTHYSTSAFVFFYLMRQEPYNTLLIKLQNYQQENPNRMFNGLKEIIEILSTGNDNRELIPEFYSKIEFFLNLNCCFYGYRANNKIVNNVDIDFMKENNISPFLISDYVGLIFEHKKLLNSNLISSNIYSWINNIFGIGQLPHGKNRKNCCNIFGKTTYEKMTNLANKVKSYEMKLNKKYTLDNIKYKLSNRINYIISFGQTPHQVFKEPHPKKTNISLYDNNELENRKQSSDYENNIKEDSDDEEKDDFETLVEKVFGPSKNQCIIQSPCIYFEHNIINNKIFALSENEEIFKINKIFNVNKSYKLLTLKSFQVKSLEKINLKEDIYNHIYKPKYSFSSFKNNEDYEILSRNNSQISQDSNSINSNKNFNFNIYYKNIFESMNIKKVNSTKNNEECYKFIQCGYLDNSFKIYTITKMDHPKKKEKELIQKSFSYICEDYVSSCCTISSNTFLIGLGNGKLIRWIITEEQKDKIDLLFDKNIEAHKGRINAIEIDKRLGLIITCGNDSYIQIRKLYNLELITPIKIKKKYIITMAKVSPINFLYVMCFNKVENLSVIFGYTLTGIKFAKSQLGFYCNIDFTHSGNIVSLLNSKEICILNGYDLTKKKINENDNGYYFYENASKNVGGSVWLEYNYSMGKDPQNYIVYIKKGNYNLDNMLFYYDFNWNKIFE